MTRLSRFKQTLLFITISFMSYLGLICQVQVMLPTTQRRSEKDVIRYLDYEQTAAQRTAISGSYHEDIGKTNIKVAGRNETLHHDSEPEKMFQDVDIEQENGLYNNTDNNMWYNTDGDTASQTQHRDVNFVPVGNMFVFGAYLDMRQKGNATVRIFVLQRRKNQDGLVCVVTGKGKNYTLYAQPYRMCENHGKEYEGWIYSYILPNTITTPPHQISVAPLHQQHAPSSKYTTLMLKIIPPRTEQNAANIGVCVPPLFGPLNLASLINFIQMCKVMGADRVFMYMGSISSEIKKFLIYHSKKDASLSVIDWNLLESVSTSRDKLWYHGQLLAIQDCLYHNMAAFRFLLFTDLDEMLVPRLAYNWPNMLNKIFAKHDQRYVAALKFKSVFFDPTRVPRDFENIVYFQHLQRTVTASRIRHKLMVQPMKVFELGIHHLSKSLSEEFESVEVNESVAVLHHYRVCGARYEPDMKCDLVREDRTMLRYKDRLTPLSHRVITDASKLFA